MTNKTSFHSRRLDATCPALQPDPRGATFRHLLLAPTHGAVPVTRGLSRLTVLVALACCLWGCKDDDKSASKPGPEAPASASTPASAEPSAQPSARAGASAKPSGSSAEAERKPLNVLLLTVDSMRAHMPWTGYERDIAPNLTALAKQSVVYTHAYAASSYTAKSVSALFTGRYPSSVYRSGWFFASFPDSNLFFTEVLQQKGIRTMGGHGHAYFDRGKQLDQGFDVWQIVPGISFDNETDKYVTSDKMTDMAIEMLSDKANTSGQFFLWYHYMDPHDQYIQHEQSPKFGKKARDRYDSEIFFTDLHLGRLFDFAKKQPWWENTAIIVSADHGEAFGEHDMWKHAFELWEVLTRVPVLIYAPGVEARQIDERRSAIDLAPTILELMGIESMPESFMGRSMVPELYGEKPDVRDPIILDLPEDRNNPERRAIISGDYKIIVKGDGRQLLFNLADDPDEKTDLAKKQPEKLQQMRKLLDETFEGIHPVAPFGGMKLRSGKLADGPQGPEGWVPPKEEEKEAE